MDAPQISFPPKPPDAIDNGVDELPRLSHLGHRLYFEKVVPVIGGLLSDRDAYAYLPRSMAYLPPPEELLVMVQSAGFPTARRIQLSGGVAQLLVGVRG